MPVWLELVLRSGRSAVEIAFLTLLPIMLVVLCVLRLLEHWGLLERLLRLLAPLLQRLGLTGLGLLAALQMSFVSFAAPVTVLGLMDQRGEAPRHLAATLAMVLTLAQANVLFPMAALGLELGRTLLFSWIGGLAAAWLTYYGWARRLPPPTTAPTPLPPAPPHTLLAVLQQAGHDALRIAVAALPMLAMALLLVGALQLLGAVEGLFGLLAPLLQPLGIDHTLFLQTLTKYIGGGMALLGLEMQAASDGVLDVARMNTQAGWLLHATDLPGLAVLCAAGPRVAAVWRPALLGAGCGIALRSMLHAWA